MTKANSASDGQTSFSATSRSAIGRGVPAGRSVGRTATMSRIVSTYMVIASTPGSTPAMNSLPMSCCVITAYTARTVEGGNIAPSVPPAAITPVAKDCG